MNFQLVMVIVFFASSVFAQSPSVTPESVVKAIGSELRAAPTVGDWINKSSAKNKLFRRTHFSKYSREKIPQVIVSGSTLLVFEKNRKKNPSVLKVFKNDNQLNFTWNGFDITKPKNMQREKWFRQKFSRIKNTAQMNLFDYLLAAAHAQSAMGTTLDQISQGAYVDPNAPSYWTAMMASMSAEEWESVNLYERYGAEDGSVLANAGAFMREQYRMSCSSDGKAGFDFPFDGDPSQPLRIGASYDAGAGLARLSINRVHADPVLSMKMGELGRLAYNVMGKDSSMPGSNAGKAYLFDGHTRTNSEHDSLREGNLLTGLYTIINKSDSVTLASPSGEASNRMYEMTQGVVALADFARACCANADCRGKAQLPTSGTGISQ